MGSKVVASFNQRQENILGTSGDPYVGNPMRIPRMARDDQSKKDVAGWNTLVEILEQVESRSDPDFTEAVFRQVLLEIFRRQKTFALFTLFLRVLALEGVLSLAQRFVEEKSGGDRGLALCGALFDAIGIHFGLYEKVDRARINASDEGYRSGCGFRMCRSGGKVVLAVEVKDRTMTLTDVEGTLQKSRQRGIRDIFFTAKGVRVREQNAIDERVTQAFAAGQNVYIFQFLDFARSILALGGEPPS